MIEDSCSKKIFALVSLSTKKYFCKKKFWKICIPWEKIWFFRLFMHSCTNFICKLKKVIQPRVRVGFCKGFFLNVPRRQINKVKRTEFLFRPPLDYTDSIYYNGSKYKYFLKYFNLFLVYIVYILEENTSMQ